MSTEQERAGFTDLANKVLNEIPPPPGPLPPLTVSSIAAIVAGMSGGITNGFVISALSAPQAGLLDTMARMSLPWWLVSGAISGGIFGGMCSFIYNAVVRRSNSTANIKNKYPETKSLSNDEILPWWIHMRLSRMFAYVDENFQRKPSGFTGTKQSP